MDIFLKQPDGSYIGLLKDEIVTFNKTFTPRANIIVSKMTKLSADGLLGADNYTVSDYVTFHDSKDEDAFVQKLYHHGGAYFNGYPIILVVASWASCATTLLEKKEYVSYINQDIHDHTAWVSFEVNRILMPMTTRTIEL